MKKAEIIVDKYFLTGDDDHHLRPVRPELLAFLCLLHGAVDHDRILLRLFHDFNPLLFFEKFQIVSSIITVYFKSFEHRLVEIEKW